MQFPRGYIQEQTNYRQNDAERKMHAWMSAFFKGVNLDIVSSSVQYWLFGKDYTHGTDKWQFDGSIQISDNGTGVAPYLNLVHTRGTNAAPTATQDGDTIGYVAGTGYASNSTFYAGGTIEFQSTDNWTSGARGTKIVFKTTDDGTSTFEESGYIHATGSWATGKPNLATNATKGFLYVPFTNGVPTGTPESITGRYPIVIGETAGGTKIPYYWDDDDTDWYAMGGATYGSASLTVTAQSGSITTSSGTIYYTLVGDRVIWHAVVDVTTNGTGASYLILSGFPYASAERSPAHGHDLGGAVAHNGYVDGTAANIWKYDGTYPGYSGLTLYVGGSYRTT